MTITQAELDYRQWRTKPDFPHIADERQRHYAKIFVERLASEDFPKPLYQHQIEAILRVIYAGEKMGKWESLLDIVTGGGKTVIMAALIAYFWQVKKQEKFLILVPNTIVRERVKDDFEVRSPSFAYRDFPFFFNSHTNVPDRLVCKVLRDKTDVSGIKDANIVIANIHQLYEGRQSQALEVLLAASVTPELVIFNDEAHNAAAEQYREVLKLLKSKVTARIDLTATPYRLDKQDLDTFPPIYEYHVQEAIRDGVVKQIVVTKPDIASVKLQYEEWDEKDQVVKVLDAEEMPWDEIEKDLKKSGAVKFVTAKNARRQQLQIAQSCLDYQRKGVPRDLQGNMQWEPLMLVVALSQKDAIQVYDTLQKSPFQYKSEELLLVHSKQDEVENEKAFLLGRRSAEGLSPEKQKLWHETRKLKVIIAVSMLREGWDVKAISVICLFRKFSYQKKGDSIYTVYGPQIIGRGLRRLRPPRERDHLFTVDHPAFSHDWLWELLSAQEYAKPLNPGDAVQDDLIADLPAPAPKDKEQDEDGEKEERVLDIEAIIKGLPDAPNVVPMREWQAHFRQLDFNKKIVSALQKITNIKSQRIGSANTAHELPEDTINVPDINEGLRVASGDRSKEQMVLEILSDIASEPHQALMAAFRQETALQLQELTKALEWIIAQKFGIPSIQAIQQAEISDIRKLHFCLPQIFDELRRPEIILGILKEDLPL